MATRYRLKRNKTELKAQRNFSVLEAAGNVLGGAVKTTGDVVGSGVGQIAGAAGGAYLAKQAMLKGGMKAIGAGAKAIGSGGLHTIGTGIGMLGPVGQVAALGLGAIAGAKIAKGVGKALHNAGNSMQN